MATTYEPATPEEVALVLEAFYAKGNIPTGFAVNRGWNPMVRRIAGATVDPEELAALKAARVIKGAEFDPLVPGPGEIPVGKAGGGVEHRPVDSIGGGRNLTAITVAASDSPAWMKARADYVCDGVDDHVQWQAAIDEAQTHLKGGVSSVPDVHLLPGQYRFGAGVTKKTARIIGGGGHNVGVRVYWDGPADSGTAITQDATANSAFCHIENINFRNGTAHPACWIETSYADQATKIASCSFIGGIDQLRIGTYANCHLTDHLRFDHWKGYAIVLNPSTTQSNSVFTLAHFTADHNSAVGSQGKAFLKVNQAATNNLGPVVIRGGRVEINSLMLAPNAFIHLALPAAPGSRSVPVEIDDVTFYEGATAQMTGLIYRDTANTTASEQIALRNVQTGRSSLPLFAGTWPSNWPATLAVPINTAELVVQQSKTAVAVTQERISRNQADIVERTRAAASSQWEHQRWATGRQEWGGGSTAPDVTLFRSAPNVLSVDTDDCIRTGRNATASRPAASAVGSGAMFYDTTLNKPIWSDGTAWRDASGTVV